MIGRLLRRRSFLSDREQDLRAREQELLGRLARALEPFGPDVEPTDLQRFREARDQLAGLFLLVIAGEFNSGKSSFINALLGERVLPEGVTPTTDRINLLRHGPEVTEHAAGGLPAGAHPSRRAAARPQHRGHAGHQRGHPPRTRSSPATSSPAPTWCSSSPRADRPFTESEREFLEQIREWGKKMVLVVNKIDLLEDAERAREVMAFVRDNAATLLGEAPEVFPVSARAGAVQARDAGDEALWEQSGFARDGRLAAEHARPAGAGAAQAAQPAQRGAAAGGAVQGDGLRAAQAAGRGRRGAAEHRRAARRLPPGDAARLRAAAGAARRPAQRDGAARGALLRRDHPVRQDPLADRLRERAARLRAGGGGRHPPPDRGGGGPGDRLDRGAQPQAVAGHEPVTSTAARSRATARG